LIDRYPDLLRAMTWASLALLRQCHSFSFQATIDDLNDGK
jgi:hypothetical protein